MTEDFLRAVLLKVDFKPDPLRKAQAFLLYCALRGDVFTADVLPKEIVGEDSKLPGVAVGALKTLGFIQQVGRVPSPAPSRNGAWVNQWAIVREKANTIKTWLMRQGFDVEPPQERQGELL